MMENMARVKSYSEAWGWGTSLQPLDRVRRPRVAIEDSMDYVGNVDRFGEIFPDVEQQEEIVVTAYYPETVDVAAVEADLQARLAELTDFMDLGEVKMGTTA